MIIMDLNINPTEGNVTRLKSYIKNLPKNSPFKKLPEYEQQLVEAGKKIRALLRVCTTNRQNLVNNLEGMDSENWFKVSSIADLNQSPDNYFDVLLWSGCDIETDLRLIPKIYPKLKVGARVYFDNLLTTFGSFLEKCLPTEEIKSLLGGELNPSLEKSDRYARLIRSLLESVLSSSKESYSVRIVNYGEKRYIVIIKEGILFAPDKELLDELEFVDSEVLAGIQEIELPESPSGEELEQLQGTIFDIVVRARGIGQHLSPSEVCDELIVDGLVKNCEGVIEKELTSKYRIRKIAQNLKLVNEQLDTLIELGVEGRENLLEQVLHFANLELAPIENWEEYILTTIDDKLEAETEEEEETEAETESEEEEEEEYPEVETPEEVPAVLLPGLENVGGFSCFMDSVLFAILLPTTGYFAKNLLDKELTIQNTKACSYFSENKEEGLEYLQNFQKQLQRLAKIVRGKEEPSLSCYPIVKEMAKCNPLTEELMSGEQQDDSEFLLALMQVFHLSPTKIRNTRMTSDNGHDWIPSKESTEKASVLEITLPETLQAPVEISRFYQRIVKSDYGKLPKNEWPKSAIGNEPQRYTREKTTIISSEALIFHVARRQVKMGAEGLKYVKNTQPVEFHEYITQKDTEQHYELQTVTIHRGGAYGGHYTVFFKNSGNWFHYDDTNEPTLRVQAKTWADVQKEGRINGSLFIYGF